MTQTTLSLALRRLIKKIEESSDEAALEAFAELPRDLDSEALLQALFPVVSPRATLIKQLISLLKNRSLKDYSQPAQDVICNWADTHLMTMPKDDALSFTKWVLNDFYRADEMHPGNKKFNAFTNAITDMVRADSNNMLLWLGEDFKLFDIWVATMSDEQIASISPDLAAHLKEDNLIRLFSMLSDMPSYERSRGGNLPHKPWLSVIRHIWQSQLPILENVACAFIKGWRVDTDDNDVTAQMFSILAATPEELKSHVKAGLFKFSKQFIQHLAKKSEYPAFDPVTSYQIVNRAEPDTTYDATKWALQFAETPKLSDLVNAVTEDVAKGTSSVLRRYPAFFLLVESLCQSWEETHDAKKNDYVKAVHSLGRHWSLYRPQFEKEAAAEDQTHYFSSNAELVEQTLGKVLARTLA
jgi:hypothetical protein